MMRPQQTTSLSSQNTINTVAHAITHKRSRDLEAWHIGSYSKRTETNYKTGVTLLEVKTILTISAKSTKTTLCDRKII